MYLIAKKSPNSGEFQSVLKPEGILIIDHRNYDSIVKEFQQKKHNIMLVQVQTRSYNEGLARYKYVWDGNCYYLNMFPITRDVLVSEAIWLNLDLRRHFMI